MLRLAMAVLLAAWPWGPPGADPFDVAFAYGAIILLIGLVGWGIVRSAGGGT